MVRVIRYFTEYFPLLSLSLAFGYAIIMTRRSLPHHDDLLR